jgi:putative zinc finger/helix-turn-helix YgiT family protein
MKCTECGGQMTEKLEARRYAGLPRVMVETIVRRCPGCGEEELGYPNIEGLQKLVARGVATKNARLVPAEIRFLRTFLGLSAKMLAETMGVRKETVSRWENNKERMGVPMERFLRLMALTRQPVQSYADSQLHELTHFAIGKAEAFKMQAVHRPRVGWESTASAAA